MTDSATAKKMARPGVSFARRYGLAFGSVTVALLKAKDWCIWAVGRMTHHLEWCRSRQRRNEYTISNPIRTYGRVISFLTGFILKIDRPLVNVLPEVHQG